MGWTGSDCDCFVGLSGQFRALARPAPVRRAASGWHAGQHGDTPGSGQRGGLRTRCASDTHAISGSPARGDPFLLLCGRTHSGTVNGDASKVPLVFTFRSHLHADRRTHRITLSSPTLIPTTFCSSPAGITSERTQVGEIVRSIRRGFVESSNCRTMPSCRQSAPTMTSLIARPLSFTLTCCGAPEGWVPLNGISTRRARWLTKTVASEPDHRYRVPS